MQWVLIYGMDQYSKKILKPGKKINKKGSELIMTAKRGKSQKRIWCEDTAKEFGAVLEFVKGEWRVVQKSTKKIAFKSAHLDDVQKYFLKEIGKYMYKRMTVGKSED